MEPPRGCLKSEKLQQAGGSLEVQGFRPVEAYSYPSVQIYSAHGYSKKMNIHFGILYTDIMYNPFFLILNVAPPPP